MRELQASELGLVTGAGKFSSILKGAEKAYEVAKPYAQKAYKAIEVGTVLGTAAELAHRGWNWVTGKKD
jgi:hypothetical protein